MSYPESVAERVIDALNIIDKSDLLRVEEIAWARGILVKDDELEGAEARLVVGQGRGVITIANAVQDQRRKRFSIAHELGHFEMHKGIQELSLCLNQDIHELPYKNASNKSEQEANEFASALLMPKRFFAPLCLSEEPSLSHITSLANQFMTSLTATALKYIKFCNEPVAIVMSQNSKIQWFQSSSDFDSLRDELNFFIEPHTILESDTLAAKLFRDSNYPKRKARVYASSWFTPGNYNKDATIQEHSIAMPNYETVLTLLWIDEEIELDDYDISEDK